MTKQFLIISEGFAPWGGPAAMRATKLASCGLKRGVRVSVLTTSVDCAHVFDDPDLLDEVVGAEILRVSNGTEYIFRKTLSKRLGHYPTRVVDRILGNSRAAWAEKCYRAARSRWDNDRPDMVYCTPPTHHVVSIAHQLADAWDRPFIMDFRDPPWEIGMPSELFEAGLSSCDLAVFNTPTAANRVCKEHSQFESKIECWTNGANTVDAHITLKRAVDVHQPLRVLFPGGVYPWVVDAISLLKPQIEMGNVCVDVYGFQEAKRRRQLKQLRSLGVNLYDPVPSSELTDRMANASANLVTLPPSYQISSKVFPMIASGRAVLIYGDTVSSRAILADLPGIFSYQADATRDAIEQVFDHIAHYDPVAGWPQRHTWLQQKTWPYIFEGIFGRYC